MPGLYLAAILGSFVWIMDAAWGWSSGGWLTTRFGFQLELTGLSRLNLGSNPLKVLRDNIPGYRLLREERGASPDRSDSLAFHD